MVVCLCATLAAIAAGCSSVAPNDTSPSVKALTAEEQVITALSRYRELIARMEPAAIALTFTEKGSVSHGEQNPISGRQAIQTFMASFADYKVVEYELKAASTLVENSSATQVGTYRQVVIIPAGQTIAVQGTFVAEWELQPGDNWLLRSMHTESTPATQKAG